MSRFASEGDTKRRVLGDKRDTYIKTMRKRFERQAIDLNELEIMLDEAAKDSAKMATESCSAREAKQWLEQFTLLCILLYTTGMRLNEALTLSGDAIRSLALGDKVALHTSKTQAGRTLKLTQGEVALWRRWASQALALIPSHGLSNTKGKPLTSRTAMRWLDPYCRTLHQGYVQNNPRVRLEGLAYGSHSFRVGYINRSAQVLHIGEVRGRIGHSRVQTTLRYCRNGNIDDITDRLSKAGL